MGRQSLSKPRADVSAVSQQQLTERGLSSTDELQATLEARGAARQALSELLASPDVPGISKQAARCAFIHEHGRLACQCPGCWLLPAHCVCSHLTHAAPQTQLVMHVHPDERGKGSNTGCLCGASLAGCRLLLHGHAPHDAALAALLADDSVTTALLWPGPDALEPSALADLAAQRSGGRIALVAIDATWDGAARMRRRYPPGVLTVRLPPDMALPQQSAQSGPSSSRQPDPQQQQQQAAAEAPRDARQAAWRSLHAAAAAAVSGCRAGLTPANPSSKRARAKAARGAGAVADGERVSLLWPVRKLSGSAQASGRVSTLEAVAAALLALEGDESCYLGLLANLMLKVDAVRTQKHMPSVYAVRDEEGGEAA